MPPPLERLERREEPKAQGGEFVEAYVAKRTRQISPMRALALDASATSAGSDFSYPPYISVNWSLLSKDGHSYPDIHTYMVTFVSFGRIFATNVSGDRVVN